MFIISFNKDLNPYYDAGIAFCNKSLKNEAMNTQSIEMSKLFTEFLLHVCVITCGAYKTLKTYYSL